MGLNKGHDKMVGAHMSRKLLTIGLDDSLSEAYSLMQSRKIRHLPVTDGVNDVIGILSDRDIQRAMCPQYDRDSPREMSYRFDPSFSVKDFMSWPVQTVFEDTRLITVAKKMLLEKISAFLVQNANGKIEGIITTDDLLKVLISLLEKEPSGAILTLKGIWKEYGLPSGNWA